MELSQAYEKYMKAKIRYLELKKYISNGGVLDEEIKKEYIQFCSNLKIDQDGEKQKICLENTSKGCTLTGKKCEFRQEVYDDFEKYGEENSKKINRARKRCLTGEDTKYCNVLNNLKKDNFIRDNKIEQK